MVIQQKLKEKPKDQNSAGFSGDDGKIITKRYFNDEINGIANGNCEMGFGSESSTQNSNAHNVKQIIVVRKPIVGSLPSFIPIG